jgi:hypothetical protein
VKAEEEVQEARHSAAGQVRHIALRVVAVAVAELEAPVAEDLADRCKVEPEPEQAEAVAGPEAQEVLAGIRQPGGKLLRKALNISMQRWIPL